MHSLILECTVSANVVKFFNTNRNLLRITEVSSRKTARKHILACQCYITRMSQLNWWHQRHLLTRLREKSPWSQNQWKLFKWDAIKNILMLNKLLLGVITYQKFHDQLCRNFRDKQMLQNQISEANLYVWKKTVANRVLTIIEKLH